MARLVPVDPQTGGALTDFKGWLADDDPFFEVMDRILAERHARPARRPPGAAPEDVPSRYEYPEPGTSKVTQPSSPQAPLVEESAAKATSCICVMELRHGALRRDDGGTLWRRIERELLGRLDISTSASTRRSWPASCLRGCRRRGRRSTSRTCSSRRPLSTQGFTVVTNNVRHFERIPGLRVEDWL